MSNPIRRRMAAAALGLAVGFGGFGSVAFAHRPPACDNGQAVGNPHCNDDHDNGDDDHDNGGGDHDHGSLISIDLGDIDLDVLNVAISQVLAVVDIDVEDVSVLSDDVINVLANANIEDVTGVDLDAAILTVVDGLVDGDILSNNTTAVSAVISSAANDVVNISDVAVAVAAEVADTDVLSDDNINVLGCQINDEGNGPTGDNNCGLLGGIDGDVLGDDLLGGDLLDGVLAILVDADADASVTAGILGLF